MSAIDFITIERKVRDNDDDYDLSTLALSERDRHHVEVIGVLSHCTRWRPHTARDRDRLVVWLESLEFDGVVT